jgi:MSHA biogenesis protein MshQ
MSCEQVTNFWKVVGGISLLCSISALILASILWAKPPPLHWDVLTFAQPGTYTLTRGDIPRSVESMVVKLWGAGGGGGTLSLAEFGGGGGGGAYAVLSNVNPKTEGTFYLQVGQGGNGTSSGNSTGQSGGATFIQSHSLLVSAGGGEGGQSTEMRAGGAGGVATATLPPSVHMNAVPGTPGGAGDSTGGMGGAAAFGGGGGTQGYNNAPGNPPQQPGGGGAGASLANSNVLAQNGAPGWISVEYVYVY